MNVGPFPLSEVIQRLRAKVPLAKIIGTAADLEAAVDVPPNAQPAVYVLMDERGGQSKYSGQATIQNVDVTVKIIRLVRSVAGEKRGSGAREKADELTAQIRAALIGWTPGSAFQALTLMSGRDDRYRAGWLAGQEHFQTSYRIHTEAAP